MAYMSQEKKAALAPAIKAVCKKFGVKATLSVQHHSALSLNISAGPIDFIGNMNKVCGADHTQPGFRPAKDHIQVNEYHYQNHYSGKALAFLSEVLPLMNTGNHNRSDIQSDYFDVGWYTYVSIGKWNKPYTVTK